MIFQNYHQLNLRKKIQIKNWKIPWYPIRLFDELNVILDTGYLNINGCII